MLKTYLYLLGAPIGLVLMLWLVILVGAGIGFIRRRATEIAEKMQEILDEDDDEIF